MRGRKEERRERGGEEREGRRGEKGEERGEERIEGCRRGESNGR